MDAWANFLAPYVFHHVLNRTRASDATEAADPAMETAAILNDEMSVVTHHACDAFLAPLYQIVFVQ